MKLNLVSDNFLKIAQERPYDIGDFMSDMENSENSEEAKMSISIYAMQQGFLTTEDINLAGDSSFREVRSSIERSVRKQSKGSVANEDDIGTIVDKTLKDILSKYNPFNKTSIKKVIVFSKLFKSRISGKEVASPISFINQVVSTDVVDMINELSSRHKHETSADQPIGTEEGSATIGDQIRDDTAVNPSEVDDYSLLSALYKNEEDYNQFPFDELKKIYESKNDGYMDIGVRDMEESQDNRIKLISLIQSLDMANYAQEYIKSIYIKAYMKYTDDISRGGRPQYLYTLKYAMMLFWGSVEDINPVHESRGRRATKNRNYNPQVLRDLVVEKLENQNKDIDPKSKNFYSAAVPFQISEILQLYVVNNIYKSIVAEQYENEGKDPDEYANEIQQKTLSIYKEKIGANTDSSSVRLVNVKKLNESRYITRHSLEMRDGLASVQMTSRDENAYLLGNLEKLQEGHAGYGDSWVIETAYAGYAGEPKVLNNFDPSSNNYIWIPTGDLHKVYPGIFLEPTQKSYLALVKEQEVNGISLVTPDEIDTYLSNRYNAVQSNTAEVKSEIVSATPPRQTRQKQTGEDWMREQARRLGRSLPEGLLEEPLEEDEDQETTSSSSRRVKLASFSFPPGYIFLDLETGEPLDFHKLAIEELENEGYFDSQSEGPAINQGFNSINLSQSSKKQKFAEISLKSKFRVLK